MADEVAPGSAFDGRWRWFGTPWFLIAVVLLALNDHVFKSHVPGWWTGKLSDVAGVAVLATLLAVLFPLSHPGRPSGRTTLARYGDRSPGTSPLPAFTGHEPGRSD